MSAREIRKQRGLTLQELGQRCKVERSRLSRYERGQVKLRPNEALRVAQALEVTYEELTGTPFDDGPPPRQDFTADDKRLIGRAIRLLMRVVRNH